MSATTFHLRGSMIGDCSRDWGCPCNFGAPPTRGSCEGGYVWHVDEGSCNGVSLDGLDFGSFVRSPAAIHLGNLTMAYVAEAGATPAQREVLELLLDKSSDAMPFAVFRSLTSNFMGIRYAAIEFRVSGLESRAVSPGLFESALGPIRNPVTGEVEPATLLKPRGFTAQRQELGVSLVCRSTIPGVSYDHSGRYGEFAHFEYRSG